MSNLNHHNIPGGGHRVGMNCIVLVKDTGLFKGVPSTGDNGRIVVLTKKVAGPMYRCGCGELFHLAECQICWEVRPSGDQLPFCGASSCILDKSKAMFFQDELIPIGGDDVTFSILVEDLQLPSSDKLVIPRPETATENGD